MTGTSDTSYNMDEPCKHYAKGTQPVTEGQTLYDPTYRSFSGWSLHRDRKEMRFPGAVGRVESYEGVQSFSLGR